MGGFLPGSCISELKLERSAKKLPALHLSHFLVEAKNRGIASCLDQVGNNLIGLILEQLSCWRLRFSKVRFLAVKVLAFN